MNKSRIWQYLCIVAVLVLMALPAAAQRFFNLTSQEVKVDSILPQFVYSLPLQGDYQDSIYTVTVKYPEYVDMPATDISHYNRLSGAALPEQVAICQQVTECRKQGLLVISFSPLVFREHRYQALVSFMLDIQAKPLKHSKSQSHLLTRLQQEARLQTRGGEDSSPAYADHSVLASGKWAKIRVSETGIHQLTADVVRRAGFSDISKVKIYGYGGNLQNEALYAQDIRETDDLKEVPQYVVDGRHYFYARGAVSWSSKTATVRTRNPYSDYGYYFITQSDESPSLWADSASFVSSCHPMPEDYHSLYEVDGFSWMQGGRNLFHPTAVKVGDTQKVVITNPTGCSRGKLVVAVTAGTNTQVQIRKNRQELGTMSLQLPVNTSSSAYTVGVERSATYSLQDFGEKDTIEIQPLSGGPVHLDYVAVTWEQPAPFVGFGSQIPAAEYVYGITPQDHHADGAADMVIIIPTSQKLLKQAQRLKEFHETQDGLRVNIVPADELYNEFSSGTPDANAYRRYLRMLSDRAATAADMPKYLLLFGDCVWDNRMLTADCRLLNPDDYLLCHESDDSFSKTTCYVSDSWLGIIGEGKGADPRTELQDVAVGRFPVTTAQEAKILVDKTISYKKNANAGAWQNTLMFMGDDGNENLHMADANEVADDIASLYPGYLIRKVMWDAYTRQTSSTGNTYPEVSSIIRQQQANGALVMDYAGHGSETQISHENVLKITDFESFRNENLPLWVTASCDIMPYDGTKSTIGEAALLNEKGGAVAFYGTTRTVFAQQNKYMNRAFLRRVLSREDGKPLAIGEAHRLAQNDVMLGNVMAGEIDRSENHLQYALLGDPALSLNLPMMKVVVDSINGISCQRTDTVPLLRAGDIARIAGHVETDVDFQGVVTATVRDSRELVICKLNDATADGASTAFQYYDRQKTLYQGADSVSGGKFAFSFAVPKDINYSGDTGLMNLYAVSNDKALRANGESARFKVGGSVVAGNDSIGPSVFCYLNSPTFVDGGNVNTTPYFVARISDKDGINAAGSGLGHDLKLVIDGDQSKTYNLNGYFSYDFGTYTSGSTCYSIPELAPGRHQLTFTAWDIQNNSSTTTLHFNVVSGLAPSLFDVGVTENPARSTTTFIVSHDRTESRMDVVIELYDTSGRQLWRHAESGVPASEVYTVKWDLSVDGGRPLGTGIYLYRVKVSSDGSSYASKTRKLIIIK